MSEKIHAITKRPGGLPRSVWVSNSLKNLQAQVDGYIETVTVFEDMTIICNEEGRLLGLPYNCTVCGVPFYGDIIFAGVSGDVFADLPISYQKFKEVFSNLWKEESQ